jgi:hypothetical protein
MMNGAIAVKLDSFGMKTGHMDTAYIVESFAVVFGGLELWKSFS